VLKPQIYRLCQWLLTCLLHEGSVVTVVGLVGEKVILPCKYNVKTHGISNVCWRRDHSWFGCEYTLITTDGLSMNFRPSKRYDLPSKLHTGDVSLTIKKAQKSDSGFYICRIEIAGLFNDLSHTVCLIIKMVSTQIPKHALTYIRRCHYHNSGVQYY
uniref:Ig-like domain-containing protein n=1 Tax=Electrophorus electricus TaxID=8005 RepID=A0A4W4H142_ELEEL